MNIDQETETMAVPYVIGEEPIIKHPTPEDVQAAWDKIVKDNSWFQTSHPELPPTCQHTYMFALNANHTVVRGCIHCGETSVTLAMGDPSDLQWHRIQEPE